MQKTDYGKVQEARLYWRNQWNLEVDEEPTEPTYEGRPVSQMPAKVWLECQPVETNLQFLTRTQNLDRWTTHLKLKFGYKRYRYYTGKQAREIWAEYSAWHSAKVARVITKELFRKPRTKPVQGDMFQLRFA